MLEQSNGIIRILILFNTFLISWILLGYIDFHHYVYLQKTTSELTPAERTARYAWMKEKFALVDPFELPIHMPLLPDADELGINCSCPRIFYPYCGKNNVTYVNGCVLLCTKQTTLRRPGPCVTYRRNDHVNVKLSIPTKWKYSKNVDEALTKHDFFDEVYLSGDYK